MKTCYRTIAGIFVLICVGWPARAAVPDLATLGCVKAVLSGFPDTVSINWSPPIYRSYTDPTNFTRAFWPMEYVYRSPDGSSHTMDFYIAGGDLNDYDLVGFHQLSDWIIHPSTNRVIALAKSCNIHPHQEGPPLQ